MQNEYDRRVTRRTVIAAAGLSSGVLLLRPSALFAAVAAPLSPVEPQPYFAGVNRALEALAKLGAPAADAQQIAALARQSDGVAVDAAEKILGRYTLASLTIDPDGTARVMVGGAPRTLIEQGWRMFLVRIANPTARTNSITVTTGSGWTEFGGGPGNMLPGSISLAQRAYLMDTLNKAPLIEKMWVTSELYETAPVTLYGFELHTVPLSGIPVEYRVIQLFSRDAGRRSARLTAYTFAKPGAWPSESGHQEFDFECLASRTIELGVLDADGRGCVASLIIKDKLDHIYPPQAMRLAPDLFFQPQIYRADGETMRLSDGEYTVESKRGPEYLVGQQTVTIDTARKRIDVKLQRWIDPSKWGWYSGDTHIHAGGCAHYQIPTEGVSPETMIRQVRGEGLSVGDILTWGPSWYYQKLFFTGQAVSPTATLEHPELQAANNASLQPHATAEDADSMLRYDVEVSGFPSSHAGHLVLLRLKEQDYPGTKLIEDWPSWNLPILKWVKAQGDALGGYAHCGLGMVVESKELPNYEIPPMDGVGTQEAIIDVTHGVCDFLSGTNTNPIAELNGWYHMLNCGFRMSMIGETDFPCASDYRPGAGRSYVRLDKRPKGDAGYEEWVRGLKQGRLYCGDGRSHFLDYKVNGRRTGEDDLNIKTGATLAIEALVAARLEPQPTPDTEVIRKDSNGYHVEKARIGDSREVFVELVVNGVSVDKVSLIADGTPRPLRFKTPVARSSWVALRIFPSAHTHPVFVLVGNKPIRASKRSAQWCRACVDKVREVKFPFMRESERPAAEEAFEHARKTYDAIISESEVA
jgi:hypothetical protein